MTTGTDMVVSDAAVRPLLSVDDAVEQVKVMIDFRDRVLVDGIDYGKIMKKGKPTLFKSGAEKLAGMFGLSIEHECVNKTEDWKDGFFFYHYRCTVRARSNGIVVSTCDGSANSKEEKYRYRKVPEWKADEYTKDTAFKISTGSITSRILKSSPK